MKIGHKQVRVFRLNEFTKIASPPNFSLFLLNFKDIGKVWGVMFLGLKRLVAIFQSKKTTDYNVISSLGLFLSFWYFEIPRKLNVSCTI